MVEHKHITFSKCFSSHLLWRVSISRGFFRGEKNQPPTFHSMTVKYLQVSLLSKDLIEVLFVSCVTP